MPSVPPFAAEGDDSGTANVGVQVYAVMTTHEIEHDMTDDTHDT